MSSLRKRVSTYFRQLSFHQENSNFHENTIVLKYLQESLTKNPDNFVSPVFYGKTPDDLPNFKIAAYSIGNDILCSISGPGTGVAGVRKRERHLEIPDSDTLDFIDDPVSSKKLTASSPTCSKKIDNRKMIIKVAGKKYGVENEERKTTKIDREFYKKNEEENVTNTEENLKTTKEGEEENSRKSHRRKRSHKLGNPPQIASSSSTPTSNFRWNRRCDNVAFGISDSLYDRDGVTKKRYGSPIADCYGVVGRKDSFLLAVADGVNWGEKAAIAARSAVHGSLRYLNETVFQDTQLFADNPEKNVEKLENSANLMKSTREIFVSLLRSFKCAHDLILENDGMLTTLTVGVVLPLEAEKEEVKRKFVCCVCNVGDTLAYAFSSRDGLRELTRGSHDVTEDRDVRDALGALGPVDGKNPELANLTLSVSLLDSDDLILIASDGLTDNFDPEICRYTARRMSANRAEYGDNVNLGRGKVEKNTPGVFRSKTVLDFRRRNIEKNEAGLPLVSGLQRYEIQLRLLDDVIRRSGATPLSTCENLVRHVRDVTNEKRCFVEAETQQRRGARRKALEKCIATPGKLDHVTVVVCAVGKY